MDISLALKRFNSLQNTSKKSDSLWKPTPGKHQIRLVPYKFNKDIPFIELYFHYNINNKTYLSPISFGRPDPIVEFAEKLKRTGDTDDWKAGKKMEPKLRTFAPVIVRGKENEGVKFWGFGKTVYQELLGYFADPDYGDLSDPFSGRDIVVDYAAAEGGASYPTTTIRVKPTTTKLHENDEKIKELIGNEKEITTIYSELSYDELKKILENWLAGNTTDEGAQSATQETLVAKTEKSVSDSFDFDTKPHQLDDAIPHKATQQELPWDETPSAPVSKTTQQVADAFEDLFK
jgi:hypothetical protein